MIPELSESDSANIKERTMMAVNKQQTNSNKVSTSYQKYMHQGLVWWDCRYKHIKFLINYVASKKAHRSMKNYLNKVK